MNPSREEKSKRRTYAKAEPLTHFIPSTESGQPHSVLASARRQLAEEAMDVQVLYITVDPERDTPERMKEYLGALDPTFIGGTDSPDQLAKVRGNYGILAASKKSIKGGYVVPHSSYVYLVDRNGNLRALMPYGRAPDDYVHDLRILLRQEESDV